MRDPNLSKLVDNLVKELQSDPNLLRPIELTPAAIDMVKQLKLSLENIPQDNDFAEFLRNNVNYKVEVLAFVPEEGSLVFINVRYIKDPLKGVGGDSGVYTLSLDNNSDYYVGSASNMKVRISQHYDGLQRLRHSEGIHKNLLTLGELSNITWSQVYKTPNYHLLAIKTMHSYKFSLGEWTILQGLTELVPRILEQSLIFKFKPNFNSSAPVNFYFRNWSTDLLKEYDFNTDGSRPTELRNVETGELIHTYASISHAHKALGISRNMANRYLNSAKGFESKVLNMQVSLNLVGVPLYDKPIVHRNISKHPRLELPGGSLESMKPGYCWAFFPDKVNFLGPYLSMPKMHRSLNPAKTRGETTDITDINPVTSFKEFANKEKLLNTEKGQFYSVKAVGLRGRRDKRPTHPWDK